jgi:glycosyltransferase involved in cell wall biosynthesis
MSATARENIRVPPVVIVAAHNEADRIGDALDALAAVFPGASLWVADDASADGTAEVARAHGATVVGRARPVGKGGNVTAAAEAALAATDRAEVALLCDGDLGRSAAELSRLVEAVEAGEHDLAVAAFRRREGGGFGVALGFARWAIRRLCGFESSAPISGQRAMRVEVLRAVLPFAAGYGMEVGMTVDAVRAGFRVGEIELDLEHRATGRTVGGFVHRARQLADFVRAYRPRSGGKPLGGRTPAG